MKAFSDRYGPWAAIAGGSEGIGLAFAREAAVRGCKLVLLAHDQPSLDAAAAELSPTTEVVTVLGDLADDGAHRLIAACDGREVGLLIANAASAPKGHFLDDPVEVHRRAIAINVDALVVLAHALGGPMRARGRGGIVTMSSLSSLQGSATFPTYAATKAFTRIFAEGLWAQSRRDGVDVTTIVAPAVDTPAFRSSQPRGGPRPVDAAIIATAGLDGLGKRPVVFPTRQAHLTSALFARLLPRRAAIDVMARITHRMYD